MTTTTTTTPPVVLAPAAPAIEATVKAQQHTFIEIRKRSQDQQLVYGYVHQIQQKLLNNNNNNSKYARNNNSNTLSNANSHQIIPVEIIELCLLYFYLNIYELAYDMTDTWDGWDPRTLHSSMSVEDGDVLVRAHSGYNPYSFGTRRIESGVSLWRFECVCVYPYWVGIFDDRQAKKESEGLESGHKDFYSISVELANVCCKPSTGVPKDMSSETKAKLKFGGKVGDVMCMCVEYETDAITLSFSINKSEFITVCRGVNPDCKYLMCLSETGGGKIKLVASTHFS